MVWRNCCFSCNSFRPNCTFPSSYWQYCDQLFLTARIDLTLGLFLRTWCNNSWQREHGHSRSQSRSRKTWVLIINDKMCFLFLYNSSNRWAHDGSYKHLLTSRSSAGTEHHLLKPSSLKWGLVFVPTLPAALNYQLTDAVAALKIVLILLQFSSTNRQWCSYLMKLKNSAAYQVWNIFGLFFCFVFLNRSS